MRVKKETGEKSPAVSIGLPVFNGEAYIGEAIESILSQTYYNFELVISDNASTDATAAICRSYAARDPRIRYIRRTENQGAASNFNEVFHASRGRYFCWAAHDDLIAPEYLSKCVDVLEADEGCILAHAATVSIDAAGRESLCFIDWLACDSDDPVRRFDRWMSGGLGECNPMYGLMRREYLARTSLIGGYPGSDYILLAEIAILGHVRMIQETLFKRRYHPAMASRAHADSQSWAAWFRGVPVWRRTFPILRLAKEFMGVIGRAEVPLAQRLRLYLSLAKWAWIVRRQILKDLLIPLYENGRRTPLTEWLRDQLSALRGRGAL